MLPSYKGDYTQQQADAVATLLEACGNAALMSYAAKVSGAYPYDAIYGMVQFMGYDKSAVMLERDYHPSADWDVLVYEQLAAGRPVLYGGYDSSYQNGHTFIVDGYKEGYYHLNWGWGGSSDGYYLLSALNPKAQGIGGGSASGYNFHQDAIINVMPAKTESDYTLEVMCDGAFGTSRAAYTARGTVEFNVGNGGKFRYFSLGDVKVKMGVNIAPQDGGEATFYPAKEMDFKSYYGTYQSEQFDGFSIEVASLPNEGSYIVTPAFEYNGNVFDVAVKVGETKALQMECSTIGVKFAPEQVPRTLTADNVKLLHALYSGKQCSFSVDIHNSGEEYLGLIKAGLVDNAGSVLCWIPSVPINVNDGETVSTIFTGTLNSYSSVLSPGEYLLNIYDEAGNIICSNPTAVTVTEAPQGRPIFNAELTMAGNSSGEGTNMSPYLIGDETELEVNISVTSGLFDDVVYIYAFYADEMVNGVNKEADYTEGTNNKASFFISPGESQKIVYTLGTADFDLNKTIYLQAYGYKSDLSTGSNGWIGRKVYVKRTTGDVGIIEAGHTGIYPNPASSIASVRSNSGIETVKIYSLTGAEVMSVAFNGSENVVELNVDGLIPGHYAAVVKTTEGIETYRLIKK